MSVHLIVNLIKMIKCFKYLLCFLIISLFINKNGDVTIINPPKNNLEHSNYTQLTQKNNDNAVQIETQTHFVERTSNSYSFNFKKVFLNYFTTTIPAKELFFSFLTRLNGKILNSTLLNFSSIQIIYPFHSFW